MERAGWGTIIYLAAIAGIDPSYYEAATIDGCNRLQKVWHITIPGIMGIIDSTLLRVGWVMEAVLTRSLIYIHHQYIRG